MFWIDWYPADPAAGTLPFPSGITSLDWHTQPEKKSGIGEVHGKPRTFNRRRRILGLDTDHVCGTKEEHYAGEVEDDTRPPMRYLPSGLPVCCVPDRREAVAEESDNVRSLTLEATPRITVAVESDTALSLMDNTTNRYSLVSECDCPEQEWDTYTRSESLVTDCECPVEADTESVDRSSLVTDCECPEQEWDNVTRRTSIVTECDCVGEQRSALVYRSALLTDCECPEQETDDVTRRNATATECECPKSNTTTDTPTSGPGTTCSTALDIALNSPYVVTVPSGMDSLWLRFPIDPTGPYWVSIACTDGSPQVTVWDGTTCGGLHNKFELTSSGYQFTFTDYTHGWAEVHMNMFGAHHVTVTAGAGYSP